MLLTDISQLNQTSFSDLIAFIQSTINVIISISALLAVIFLVYSGIEYIMSRGEGDKAEKAQKSLIYTLIGLVMCFISPLVIKFILTTILKQ